MKRNVLAGAVTLAVAATAIAGDLNPKVQLNTSLGPIVLELNGEKAPITVDNFLKYAKSGHYNGLIFHRVMANFMIQGGGYDVEMDERRKGLRAPIKNEWENGLKNKKGTIAMARTRAPDSATAQFFINVVDNTSLDQARPQTGNAAYCVFGKVVEGMETVEAIRTTAVTTHPKLPMGQVVPETPVVIESVKIVGDFDASALEQRIAELRKAEVAKWRERWPDDVKAFVEAQEKELGKEAQVTPSGMTYFVLSEGAGPKPGPRDRVDTHYTGWLVDGTKFDSSHDRGKPFTVNMQGGVIRGWLEALADMQTGEKRKIVLPPGLAYGKRGSPPKIPADSYLVFDVELVEIK